MDIRELYENNAKQKFFSCAFVITYHKGGLRALKNAVQRKIDGEFVHFGFECNCARYVLLDAATFECKRV